MLIGNPLAKKSFTLSVYCSTRAWGLTLDKAISWTTNTFRYSWACAAKSMNLRQMKNRNNFEILCQHFRASFLYLLHVVIIIGSPQIKIFIICIEVYLLGTRIWRIYQYFQFGATFVPTARMIIFSLAFHPELSTKINDTIANKGTLDQRQCQHCKVGQN